MKYPPLDRALTVIQTVLGVRKFEEVLAEVAHRRLLEGSIAAEEDHLGPWEPVKPPLDSQVK